MRRERPRAAGAALSVLLAAGACTSGADHEGAAPATSGPATPQDTTSTVTEPAPISLRAARSQPVDDPYFPQHGEPYLDTLHYDLNLSWHAAAATLDGTVQIVFRVTEPRRQVQLDLGAPLAVSATTLDGHPVSSRHPGDALVVRTGALGPGRLHKLSITYAGSPEPTAFPGSRTDIDALGWTTQPDGSVWAMQEPFGAFTWYPVNDQPSDKAFYDATISSDNGFTNVFNGQLLSTSTSGETTTSSWHLDQPAASYLVTIAIGSYAPTSATGPAGVPVTYWTQPGDTTMDYLDESPQMLAWLSHLLGPYPFASAGVVVVPARSAMETQTLVTFSDAITSPGGDFLRPDLLHEFAHQWLGDSVTTDNWPDLWLNEGLTMYVQLLWEDDQGLQGYTSTIAEWAAEDNADRARYGPPGAYHPDEFASRNVYLSGAVMLDRIRQRVGDAAFFAALRGWPQRHANASADRTDFARWWSQRTGVDLTHFINAWLISPTTPTELP
ncbi:MAG: M1 family metallopeptidase [Nocardioidaceae bacterium]